MRLWWVVDDGVEEGGTLCVFDKQYSGTLGIGCSLGGFTEAHLYNKLKCTLSSQMIS